VVAMTKKLGFSFPIKLEKFHIDAFPIRMKSL
jgi:hypothetical protein